MPLASPLLTARHVCRQRACRSGLRNVIGTKSEAPATCGAHLRLQLHLSALPLQHGNLQAHLVTFSLLHLTVKLSALRQ